MISWHGVWVLVYAGLVVLVYILWVCLVSCVVCGGWFLGVVVVFIIWGNLGGLIWLRGLAACGVFGGWRCGVLLVCAWKVGLIYACVIVVCDLLCGFWY